MSDFAGLLHGWVHDGRMPLSHSMGYSEVLLQDNFESLAGAQREALQEIIHIHRMTVEKWHELLDYFRDRELSFSDEIDADSRAFLHEHIFQESLALLHTSKKRIELLSQEVLGPLTDEQRECIGIMDRSCQFAINAWEWPISYFGTSDAGKYNESRVESTE